jgi:hypothetical protein
MGIFRRRQPDPEIIGASACPHVALSPRWDDPSDMGHEDLASAFVCQACGKTLTPVEARAVRVN